MRQTNLGRKNQCHMADITGTGYDTSCQACISQKESKISQHHHVIDVVDTVKNITGHFDPEVGDNCL